MKSHTKCLFTCSSLFATALLAGCATQFIPDPITNPQSNACQADFQKAVVNILRKQDQYKGTSDADLNQAAAVLRQYVFSNPRGYREGFSASKGDTRYGFTFKSNRSSTCYLRLYGRSSGSFQYVNTLTFIESEALPNCQCPHK